MRFFFIIKLTKTLVVLKNSGYGFVQGFMNMLSNFWQILIMISDN